MARRRRPEAPLAEPSDPPDWLWQFRDAHWEHVEFPPAPDGYEWGPGFWAHCRARDHWREQCKAWLRDNDRILAAMWPEKRAEFTRQAEETPWKVLRHDRDWKRDG